MTTQAGRYEQRTLWTDVHKISETLKPLPALVFVIRCAMRSRPWVAGTEGREALIEYNASIRDGLTFSLLPDEQERAHAAPRFWESYESNKTNMSDNREIYNLIKTCYFMDIEPGFISHDGGLTGSVRTTIRKFHRGIARRSGDRHEVRLASIPLLLDASRLAKHEGQGPLDASEAGPLDGLWPIGAPDWFVKFEKEHPLDLGLSRTGFHGSISGMGKVQDARPRQGGRATETPGKDMDTVEQFTDHFDADDDFQLPKAGEVDPALLAIYAGRWVAWSPDGVSIVAHADDTTGLTKLVTEAGVNPSRCVFEHIEAGSLI